jgi:hypothetical protein
VAQGYGAASCNSRLGKYLEHFLAKWIYTISPAGLMVGFAVENATKSKILEHDPILFDRIML